MDLPILGATGPSGTNGGGSLAAIDRTYAVELCTADGGMHTLTLKFGRPTQGGAVDFGALKDFNPKAQAMASVARAIRAAHLNLTLDGEKLPPVMVDVEGGIVVWKHVTSFAFLGEWDVDAGDVIDVHQAAA